MRDLKSGFLVDRAAADTVTVGQTIQGIVFPLDGVVFAGPQLVSVDGLILGLAGVFQGLSDFGNLLRNLPMGIRGLVCLTCGPSGALGVRQKISKFLNSLGFVTSLRVQDFIHVCFDIPQISHTRPLDMRRLIPTSSIPRIS
ncbi:hypothetical protein C266_10386 [Pandoraea sp. SD6-2]|nr:hypothetical protein C266_10386 [Pandoraea sp. SD6-2]